MRSRTASISASLHGLRQVVARPEPHRLDGRLLAGVPGHHDRFGVRADLLEPLQHVDAGHVRHADVEDGGVEGLLARWPGGPSVPFGQTVTSCPSRGSSVRMNSWSDRSSSTNRTRRRLCGVGRQVRLLQQCRVGASAVGVRRRRSARPGRRGRALPDRRASHRHCHRPRRCAAAAGRRTYSPGRGRRWRPRSCRRAGR